MAYATVSTPAAVLLFHEGSYLGTATAVQYSFQPDIVRTDDNTIQVTYHFPQGSEGNADTTGRVTATFAWNSVTKHVDMSGTTPPDEWGGGEDTD